MYQKSNYSCSLFFLSFYYFFLTSFKTTQQEERCNALLIVIHAGTVTDQQSSHTIHFSQYFKNLQTCPVSLYWRFRSVIIFTLQLSRWLLIIPPINICLAPINELHYCPLSAISLFFVLTVWDSRKPEGLPNK